MATPLQTAASSASASQRLADQLHLLSALAETITYRMLDLEERLAALEAVAPSPNAASEEDPVGLRLVETEARLEQLEQLLQAGANLDVPVRRLEAVPVAYGGDPDAIVEESMEACFPEEGEQPFMDEIVA